MIDVIKQHEWKIIAALFLALFISSIWGLEQCDGECVWLTDKPQSIFDSLFFTLQMIVMNYGGIHGLEAPWQLQLSRFGLPLLASYSLFKGFVALFSYNHLKLRVRFWREHIVILGGGDQTIALVRAYLTKSNPPRILVVDLEDTPGNDEMQAQGVVFLKEDARLSRTLAQIRLNKAQCAYVMTGSDQTNLEIYKQIDSLFRLNKEVGRPHQLKLFVRIEEHELRSVLSVKIREGEVVSKEQTIKVTFFSTYENSARALLTGSLGPHLQCPIGTQPHILIFGKSRLVEYLIIWGARLGHYPEGKKLRITYVDETAEKLRDSIYARYPALDPIRHKHMNWNASEMPLLPIIDLEFIPTSAEAFTGNLYSKISTPISVVYICADKMQIEEVSKVTKSIRAQYSGVDNLNEKTPNIVLCDSGGKGGILNVDKALDLNTFNVDEEGVKLSDGEMVIGGIREHWARAIHEYYSSLYPDNAIAWEDLAECLRDSNRQAADHWKIKFDLLNSLSGSPEKLDINAHKDMLMRLEHDRWCAERLMSGWRYCEKPATKEDQKSAKNKLRNWCLCDFENLSPEDKEKDGDVIEIANRLNSLDA